MNRILSIFLLALALGATAGCSDTECHDKLVPGGGKAKSTLCQVGGGDAGMLVMDATDDGGGNDDVLIADDTLDDTATEDTAANNGDDSGANNGVNNGNNNGTTDALIGTWVSAGDDIAPLLQDGGFGIDSVSVTFDSGGTYSGVISLDSGDDLPYAGNYSIDDRSTPWSIQMSQTTPQALTNAGIIEVDGDTFRLEVVQVDPPTPGFQPPTGGFGTTQGVDDPADNIQVYRRQ